MSRSREIPKRSWRDRFTAFRATLILFALAVIISLPALTGSGRDLNYLENFWRFAGKFFPPDLSVTPAVLSALGETVQIAVMATVFAGLIALPLAVAYRRCPQAVLVPTDMGLYTRASVAVLEVLGWGLVINLFAEDAAWNNWQGYLLGPLGLGGKEGTWAFANVGVLVALALGFVVTCAARRGTVRRQEEGLAPTAADRPDSVVSP